MCTWPRSNSACGIPPTTVTRSTLWKVSLNRNSPEAEYVSPKSLCASGLTVVCEPTLSAKWLTEPITV
jgi:hypothetical protein